MAQCISTGSRENVSGGEILKTKVPRLASSCVVPLGVLEDSKRASRSAQTWRDRAIAWCEWRAGSEWQTGTHKDRFDATRKDYLDAAALIRNAEYSALREVRGLHLVLAPAVPVVKVPARERALANNLPVKALVARLMGLDATLTAKKTLSHLSKEKLAHMIFEREFVREAHAVGQVRA